MGVADIILLDDVLSAVDAHGTLCSTPIRVHIFKMWLRFDFHLCWLQELSSRVAGVLSRRTHYGGVHQ